ncbi:MAG: response regulator [Aestuariibaculum sp.]
MNNVGSKKREQNKKLLSYAIVVSILIVLFFGYLFVGQDLNIKIIAMVIFILAVLQTLFLQYIYKKYLDNDMARSNLEARIKQLKHQLQESDKTLAYNNMYLANISYDMQTPLSTVLGMLKMLKREYLTADQKAQLEIAKYSTEHVLQLAKLVTNNTDVVMGNIKLNMQTIDLELDLKHLFKVFEYQAWEKNLGFEYKFLIDRSHKYFLIGDIVRIQQILINLFNNALKFTNSGKISIIVDKTVNIDDNQIITFYVKDTGAGIEQDKVKRIFETSKNFNATLKRNYKGNGIGLSISYHLIGLMGGELKLESKENEGSTFYFNIQLKRTLNVEKEEVYNPIFNNEYKILVAEDNQVSQKVIKFLLQKQGVECVFAKNGTEAVQLYKILDFDMVVMDIYMPDMDGYEATQIIKTTDKYKASQIPIIGVSASAFKEDIERAKNAGIQDFLSKPIAQEELKGILVKYFTR